MLVLAALGLHCSMGVPLVAASRGYSSFGVWASHCSGASCCRTWTLGHSFSSSCGAQT